MIIHYFFHIVQLEVVLFSILGIQKCRIFLYCTVSLRNILFTFFVICYLLNCCKLSFMCKECDLLQTQGAHFCHICAGAYLWKIAPMASTKIRFYICYLLIISPGIHVYVYYMVLAKLLQENYLKNLF